MKTIITAAIMLILSSVIMSGQQVNPNYDSTLAKTLLSADPTIREKVFEPEFFHWHGSAALPENMPVYDKIWKINP